MTTRSGLIRLALALAATLALAGCGGGKPPSTFDLTAPQRLSGSAGPRGVLIVTEPTAIATLDGQRVVVKPSAGEVTFLPNAQWADRLPKLVQARMIEAFENARWLSAVGRPGDRLTPDFQLVTEIRSFEIDAATGTAHVEITAKAINDKTGKIAVAGVFSARRPVGGPIDGPNATRALDGALAEVLAKLVTWRGPGV